jgi:hypothetical protein
MTVVVNNGLVTTALGIDNETLFTVGPQAGYRSDDPVRVDPNAAQRGA